MSNNKAYVRLCLLCEFDKVSTEVYEEDATDKFGNSGMIRMVLRPVKMMTSFTFCKRIFWEKHKMQPESSCP